MTASAPAVEDLSFTALPGQTIALVGPTGAGKSTAIALLHRAFDPQSGIIKIDGMDMRGLTLTALRRNIGVVFQEALLFNRSIAENLRVGKPDATEAEMREAAERAQALEFIERGDRRFDTSVGERGRTLSGGERQRLSIARALLKDPPILILDEATSALDAVTEAKVKAALDEVMKRPHHLRHRAPAGDHPQRHAHPGVRATAGDRERHLRRTGRAGRPFCRARPGAVHGAGAGAERGVGERCKRSRNSISSICGRNSTDFARNCAVTAVILSFRGGIVLLEWATASRSSPSARKTNRLCQRPNLSKARSPRDSPSGPATGSCIT